MASPEEHDAAVMHDDPESSYEADDTANTLAGIRAPTASVPLLAGLRRDMLAALEQFGGSYVGICLMLDRLADDLVANPTFIPANKTVATLRENAYIYVLIHAIPSDVLGAIIRGTVAFEFRCGGRKPHQYSKKTGGTYVAAVSIEGRHGKFLSGAELGRLADDIDRYIAAWDEFESAGLAWTDSPASRAHQRFAGFVDGAYGSPREDGGPRFIRNAANRRSVAALAAMFRRRQVAAVDMNEWQVQSPLMVGCNGAAGSTIEDRVMSHYPQSGLRSTTHTWALTLCMIRCMDLGPVVTTVAVLPTWRKEDLPMSERLVTALAQSLVTQDGFNVDQPGNHADGRGPRGRATSKQMVFVGRSWFRDSLKRSTVHLEREAHQLRVIKLLRENVDVDALGVQLEGTRKNVAVLRAEVDKLEQEQDALADHHERLQQRMDKARARTALAKEVAACMDLFHKKAEARRDAAQTGVEGGGGGHGTTGEGT